MSLILPKSNASHTSALTRQRDCQYLDLLRAGKAGPKRKVDPTTPTPRAHYITRALHATEERIDRSIKSQLRDRQIGTKARLECQLGDLRLLHRLGFSTTAPSAWENENVRVHTLAYQAPGRRCDEKSHSQKKLALFLLSLSFFWYPSCGETRIIKRSSPRKKLTAARQITG